MPSPELSSRRRLTYWAALLARSLLQSLVLASCIVFVGYWFAISLNAWWYSNAAKDAARHFSFPYLSDYNAHRRDKADRYLLFSFAKDLTLAVRRCLLCIVRAPLVALQVFVQRKAATRSYKGLPSQSDVVFAGMGLLGHDADCSPGCAAPAGLVARAAHGGQGAQVRSKALPVFGELSSQQYSAAQVPCGMLGAGTVLHARPERPDSCGMCLCMRGAGEAHHAH